jgi:hypothetical protein
MVVGLPLAFNGKRQKKSKLLLFDDTFVLFEIACPIEYIRAFI